MLLKVHELLIIINLMTHKPEASAQKQGRIKQRTYMDRSQLRGGGARIPPLSVLWAGVDCTWHRGLTRSVGGGLRTHVFI